MGARFDFNSHGLFDASKFPVRTLANMLFSILSCAGSLIARFVSRARTFIRGPLQSIPAMPCPSFHAQMPSRTRTCAPLDAEHHFAMTGFVHDGVKHGRMMMECGHANGRRSITGDIIARHRQRQKSAIIPGTLCAVLRGNDRNPNGPRPAQRGSVARRFRSAIERGSSPGTNPGERAAKFDYKSL
jgi:hypothetical protein